MPSSNLDAESLALALDHLTREVLHAARSPQEAWEQLRQDLLPSADLT